MPTYDLADVRAAARDGNIQYLSRASDRDARNLSEVGVYVDTCLSNLDENDFHETVSFESNGLAGGSFDVYLLNWRNAENVVFPLYIKLKIIIDSEENIILLASFHQQRG